MLPLAPIGFDKPKPIADDEGGFGDDFDALLSGGLGMTSISR